MIRAASLTVLMLSLTACDGVMRIRGVAPDNTTCVLKLIEDKTGEVKNTIPVSGSFEETIFFAGAWRAPEINVTAECGGKTVAIAEDPEFPEVDLGTLEP